MLKIINAVEDIENLFMNGIFKLEYWNTYMDSLLPNHKNLFLDDMSQTVATGRFTFENDYLPVLNAVLLKEEKKK